MRGNQPQRTQHIGSGHARRAEPRPSRYARETAPKYEIDLDGISLRQTNRQPSTKKRETDDIKSSTYRRRRVMAVCLLILGLIALVFAVFAQTSVVTDGELAIDPNSAAPDVTLATASENNISTPIRPVDITALGYHPEGDSLIELAPRGENLSDTPLLDMFGSGETAERIQYYMMDPAERTGPHTGALDVGAEAGTTVYAPITGTISAIRPDPAIGGANTVEIKSSENPNLRVSVSLVRDITEDTGVDTSVTAGMTELGAVSDSAKSLQPQLASYTTGAGNHVTLQATKVN